MLKKKIVKSRHVVKVTFEVPQAELPEGIKVKTIRVVGEFNDWDETAEAMTYYKKYKTFRVTIELEPGREYQFRYLLNDGYWCNDWAADKYTANQFGEDNCVVVTPQINNGPTKENES